MRVYKTKESNTPYYFYNENNNIIYITFLDRAIFKHNWELIDADEEEIEF